MLELTNRSVSSDMVKIRTRYAQLGELAVRYVSHYLDPYLRREPCPLHCLALMRGVS